MKKRKVILIIDDDSRTRSNLMRMLEDMGHQVHESPNDTFAMSEISKNVPHLIILDTKIKNGIKCHLLKDIRRMDPHARIKVILIGSLEEDKGSELAKKMRTDHYLKMPISNYTLNLSLTKMGKKLDFPTLTNISEEDSLVTCRCFGELTKISETELVFKSKINFENKKELYIKGSFFEAYGLTNMKFIVNNESADAYKAIYNTKVQLIGLSEQDHQKIRKMSTIKV